VTDDALSAAVIGAGLALLGKIVFDWLKGKNGKTNGSSGEKSAEFWKVEIRDIVEEVMDHRNAKIREIVAEELVKARRR
jgi:hypothetical protein